LFALRGSLEATVVTGSDFERAMARFFQVPGKAGRFENRARRR
jgi:hypothetical protein